MHVLALSGVRKTDSDKGVVELCRALVDKEDRGWIRIPLE